MWLYDAGRHVSLRLAILHWNSLACCTCQVKVDRQSKAKHPGAIGGMQHSLTLAQPEAAQGMGEALTQLLDDGWLPWGLVVWLCLALAPLQGVQVISSTKAKRLQASPILI